MPTLEQQCLAFVSNFMKQVAVDASKKSSYDFLSQYNTMVRTLNAWHDVGFIASGVTPIGLSSDLSLAFSVYSWPAMDLKINFEVDEGNWAAWPIVEAVS